jgi:hypothetical protein
MNPQTLSPAFQQTRHARRIYVGGIPPNYADEEALKYFLNSVIAKGMSVENDNTYVLSMYINQKKCFAFVELRSIELATACLDLDGIIYKKVILKVLRANEYKPELIPPSMLGKPIVLDLTSFAFGTPVMPLGMPTQTGTTPQQGMHSNSNSLYGFEVPVNFSAYDSDFVSASPIHIPNNIPSSPTKTIMPTTIAIESPPDIVPSIEEQPVGEKRLDSLFHPVGGVQNIQLGNIVLMGYSPTQNQVGSYLSSGSTISHSITADRWGFNLHFLFIFFAHNYFHF